VAAARTNAKRVSCPHCGLTTNPGNLGKLAFPGAVTNASTFLACDPFTAAQASAVVGKVAIVDRGVCGFVVKVKNAQNAGAIAVLVADNAPGAPASLGGSDSSITIPSARITQAAGVTLKAAAATVLRGSRSMTLAGTFGFDATRKAGADSSLRPLLYTPNPLVGGSSVSHWDVSAFPNLLMEPAINSDLTNLLVPPKDLTKPLLQDIGW
jgi:hypothetical protein